MAMTGGRSSVSNHPTRPIHDRSSKEIIIMSQTDQDQRFQRGRDDRSDRYQQDEQYRDQGDSQRGGWRGDEPSGGGQGGYNRDFERGGMSGMSGGSRQSQYGGEAGRGGGYPYEQTDWMRGHQGSGEGQFGGGRGMGGGTG